MLQINIPLENRQKIINTLNQTLAQITDLMLASKQAHWNVRGALFESLHGLFDELASEFGSMADEVAERAVQLGGIAAGTLQQAAKSSNLAPYPPELFEGLDHVEALAMRLATLTNTSRPLIIRCIHLGDQASADLYIEIIRMMDKRLWMLRSHLTT